MSPPSAAVEGCEAVAVGVREAVSRRKLRLQTGPNVQASQNGQKQCLPFIKGGLCSEQVGKGKRMRAKSRGRSTKRKLRKLSEIRDQPSPSASPEPRAIESNFGVGAEGQHGTSGELECGKVQSSCARLAGINRSKQGRHDCVGYTHDHQVLCRRQSRLRDVRPADDLALQLAELRTVEDFVGPQPRTVVDLTSGDDRERSAGVTSAEMRFEVPRWGGAEEVLHVRDVAGRNQDSLTAGGSLAGAGEEREAGCSKSSGTGWHCPFPARPGSGLCQRHWQMKGKTGGRRRRLTKVRCDQGPDAQASEQSAGGAAGRKMGAGSEEASLGEIGQLDRRRGSNAEAVDSGQVNAFVEKEIERSGIGEGRLGATVEVPGYLLAGSTGVLVTSLQKRRGGNGDQGVRVVIDVESSSGGAAGGETGRVRREETGVPLEQVYVRRSIRIALHPKRPSAKEQLGMTVRQPQKKPRKRNTNGKEIQTSEDRRAAPAQLMKRGAVEFGSGEVPCLLKESQIPASPSLPSADCVVGRWDSANIRAGPGAVQIKRMGLDDWFYQDLLAKVGGLAAFKSCEWGGILVPHWDRSKEEALLEVARSKIGRGSHDQVHVAEGPYTWHSHAILGDSWPNLPSTADLLGVIRDSNLRAGGRGQVHVVVTPIGSWLLQATEGLVKRMYGASTRRQAESQLADTLQRIFDRHKCSVGYLPDVVPTEEPDFWMAVPEHEQAIGDALNAGVEAQVKAYADQLEAEGFVVGFAGHGAANARFPLYCVDRSQKRKRISQGHTVCESARFDGSGNDSGSVAVGASQLVSTRAID